MKEWLKRTHFNFNTRADKGNIKEDVITKKKVKVVIFPLMKNKD